MVNHLAYGWQGPTEFAFLQKSTFIKAVLAFVPLIAKEDLPMTCSVCGPYPKWLSFDGVSLAMLKDLVLPTADTIYPLNEPAQPLGNDVLKHSERLLIRPAPVRQQLAHFCKGATPIDKAEFCSLVKALQKKCSPLAALLEQLHQQEIFHSSITELPN